jgi:hypothetical protein
VTIAHNHAAGTICGESCPLLHERVAPGTKSSVSDWARYRIALERIRDRGWVEDALDPQGAARIAKEALGDV